MTQNWLACLSLLFLGSLVACSGGNQNRDNQQDATSTQQKTPQTQAKGQSDTTSVPDKAEEPSNSPEKQAETSGSGIKARDSVQADSDPNLSQKQQSQAEQQTQGEADSDSLNFILRGVVDGAARTEVILDKLGIAGDSKALASTVVNKADRFQFGGKIPRPGLYSIRFPSDQIIVALEGGVQKIEADFANLDAYKARGEGADGTRFMRRSFLLLNKYNSKGDSLRKVAKTTSNTDKKLRLYDTLEKRQKGWNKAKFREMKTLVQEAWDANSIAAPAIAVRAAVQKDYDFFKRMHADFKDQYPENYFVKKLGEKLQNARDYLEKKRQ